MPLLSKPIEGQRYWYRVFAKEIGKYRIFSGIFTGRINVEKQLYSLRRIDNTVIDIPREELYSSKEGAIHGLKRYEIIK